MIHLIMMFMLMLGVMGSASATSTIIGLRLSRNYKIGVQEFYRREGILSFAIAHLKAGSDLDLDGFEDFQQVHGNGEVIFYTVDGAEVTISRDPNDPHQAIIEIDGMRVVINNFPGGGQSCLNNNQCTPERVAWGDF